MKVGISYHLHSLSEIHVSHFFIFHISSLLPYTVTQVYACNVYVHQRETLHIHILICKVTDVHYVIHFVYCIDFFYNFSQKKIKTDSLSRLLISSLISYRSFVAAAVCLILIYNPNSSLTNSFRFSVSQAENNANLTFVTERETPEHDAVYNIYLKKLTYNASRTTVCFLQLSLKYLVYVYLIRSFHPNINIID